MLRLLLSSVIRVQLRGRQAQYCADENASVIFKEEKEVP